jgi:hypothetical protein
MSIEGSFALAGILLLGIGVATAAYRSSASSRLGAAGGEPGAGGSAGGSRQVSRLGWATVVLLVAGAMLLLAAGLLVIAGFMVFTSIS